MSTVQKSFQRRFVLDRILFSNGKVALTWFSHYGAVNVYDSIEVVRVLHGHGGKTLIVWTDPEFL